MKNIIALKILAFYLFPVVSSKIEPEYITIGVTPVNYKNTNKNSPIYTYFLCLGVKRDAHVS